MNIEDHFLLSINGECKNYTMFSHESQSHNASCLQQGGLKIVSEDTTHIFCHMNIEEHFLFSINGEWNNYTMFSYESQSHNASC